ncbi:MAG: type II and III secretion system protein [Armatimonadota bacterium]|nr:type II and III secretion system protein [Armatimonadota bacterium]
MNIRSFHFWAFAAPAILTSGALAQAPANTAHAEMHPVKIEVKFVEAPTDKVNAWSQSHGLDKNAAENLLTARMKDGAKMTEVALQTTMIQDQPIYTVQQDIIPFVTTDHGTPQTSYFFVPTSLDITPHFNAGGTLRLNLKIQRSEVQPSATPPDGPPNVTSQSTSTVRTLVSGGTIVIGGFVTGRKPGTDGHATLVGGTEMLVFVTATILPVVAQRP